MKSIESMFSIDSFLCFPLLDASSIVVSGYTLMPGRQQNAYYLWKEEYDDYTI